MFRMSSPARRASLAGGQTTNWQVKFLYKVDLLSQKQAAQVESDQTFSCQTIKVNTARIAQQHLQLKCQQS